jgi:3-oxoacyl-[acyl-carrier-protein] synthase II
MTIPAVGPICSNDDMKRRRVALTSIGLFTALGWGEDALWTGLMERRSAVSRPENLDLHDFPAQMYGLLPDIDWDQFIDPKKAALWSAASRAAVAVASQLTSDLGDDLPMFAGPRTGVLLGTGYGCLGDMEAVYKVWFERGWKRLKPATVPKVMPNAPASQLGILFGARGLNATISTACSSGAIAAGMAAERIRTGDLDACITGGVDILGVSSILGAWNALRVLSREQDETASRPFSADRTGLVVGEGCALFVLEDWDRAVARGAKIRAEFVGVGATNDAANVVRPGPEGEREAIAMALADAGIDAGAIDYINAHGTGTKANDSNESQVLQEMLGDTPVSSIKGNIGHAMGAAGAIEIAATVLALENQCMPPTLNYEPGDPDCTMDYVADGPRDAKLEYAMTNSFGFGGQNSVLILKRAK